jgi:hypothetical protein
MACIVDDSLTTATAGVYVTILFGRRRRDVR